MKVKIRGIYSTALTKLLKENGISVVRPSKKIMDRFEFKSEEPANTIIYDKEDLNGVVISGVGAEKVVSIIKKNLFDVVVKKLEIGDIYCGIIKEINNNIIIDLGDGEGILSVQEYLGFLKKGEKVLVQVKGRIHNKRLLSTKLRLFGENVILIKNGFTKISEYIKSEDERKRLLKISEEFKNNWGILWKAFAEGKDTEELKNEIKKLNNKEKRIKKIFNSLNSPKLIEKGINVFFIEFGAISKEKLDKIRSEVTPTVKNHHFLKSGDYSIIVDFAESLKIDNTINKKIEEVLKKEGPHVGMFYEIIHKKLEKKDIILKGIIQSVNGEIKLKRRLQAGGKFDGIGGKIESGDYAITVLKPGSWVIKHFYFNKNNEEKGKYFNINTPVEVYPKFARYIDLEIDVVEKDGKREIIDTDKLKNGVNMGIINEKLAEKAIEIAKKIKGGEDDYY